jgi:hypothetical protein
VKHRLDDLAGSESDVQPRVEVDLQPRFRAAECRERRDGDELSLAQVEPWAPIDLAEREFDDVSTKVWSDVFEALDDAFTALGVNLHEALPTALETLALLCLNGDCDSPLCW